jgi:hypothetical protein
MAGKDSRVLAGVKLTDFAYVDDMSVYGLLPIASLPCSGIRVDCTRISGLLPPHRFAVLGHDGLVARRLPIAFSCLLARGHFRVLPAPVRPVRHRAVG